MKTIELNKNNIGVMVAHCFNPLWSFYQEAKKRNNTSITKEIKGVVDIKDDIDYALSQQNLSRNDVVQCYNNNDEIDIDTFYINMTEENSLMFYQYAVKQAELTIDSEQDKDAINNLLEQTYVHSDSNVILESISRAENIVAKIDKKNKEMLEDKLFRVRRELVKNGNDFSTTKVRDLVKDINRLIEQL